MQDITVSNINKKFGNQTVFSGFSATFPAQQLTCLMGSSGCGKTTLLNMLMGFLKPDSGQIHGTSLKKSAVFQEDRLCEDFGALANIRLVCDIKYNLQEIVAHLTQIGLADSLSKPVKEYSGGMKRRLAIVRAILAPYDLLFLDEPFKGLDEETKQITIAYVKQFTQGKTVIMVTHSTEEATALGGQVLAL